MAKNIPACAEGDWNSYADFCEQNRIGLTVVGPEEPLSCGIVDSFKMRGLKIFGPDKKCARLEASKIFAKQFMKKYNIPTADFEVFDDVTKALEFVSNRGRWMRDDGLVIKADGLAAGKGVTVCNSIEEAKVAVKKMMVQKIFGSAGEQIIIEERFLGEELSLMAFCDGKTLKALPTARDYKRVNDFNQGPNTGGMGAFSPVPLSADLQNQIQEKILIPFLKGLQAENLDYRGLIYFGLMLTEQGPTVLEFNVRFGDPETQVVLPLVETDLLSILLAVMEQSLDKISLELSLENCVGVVCASGGYPEKYETGKEIWGLPTISAEEGVMVFHAGTQLKDGKYWTAGGRVLTVVGKGNSIVEARRKAYGALFKIEFQKMHFRNDIAKL